MPKKESLDSSENFQNGLTAILGAVVLTLFTVVLIGDAASRPESSPEQSRLIIGGIASLGTEVCLFIGGIRLLIR